MPEVKGNVLHQFVCPESHQCCRSEENFWAWSSMQIGRKLRMMLRYIPLQWNVHSLISVEGFLRKQRKKEYDLWFTLKILTFFRLTESFRLEKLWSPISPCQIVHSTKYHILGFLEYFHGWWFHHFTAQPIPMPNPPLNEEIPPNVQIEPPLVSLRLYPLVLSFVA